MRPRRQGGAPARVLPTREGLGAPTSEEPMARPRPPWRRRVRDGGRVLGWSSLVLAASLALALDGARPAGDATVQIIYAMPAPIDPDAPDRSPVPDVPAGVEATPVSDVHVAYVTPSGITAVPGRAEAIAGEVEAIGDWLAGQTGGGRPRFGLGVDGRPFVHQIGVPIGVDEIDRSPEAITFLAPYVDTLTGADQQDVLLFYVEGAAPRREGGNEVCGQAIPEWSAAVVWLGSCAGMDPRDAARFGFGATWTAAHELVHALGAVPTCAPHVADQGHVMDDPDDLMAPQMSWERRRSVVLDAGRDDYLGATPGCPPITAHAAWQQPVPPVG